MGQSSAEKGTLMSCDNALSPINERRARRGLFSRESTPSLSPRSSTDLCRQVSFRELILKEEGSGLQEFYLKRRTKGRSHGMDWQQDPTASKSTLLHPHRHAPHDFASLRGTVVEHQGKKWLLVTEVKQGEPNAKWRKAPRGAAIPFFYKRDYCLVRQRNKNKGDDAIPTKSWREEAMSATQQWSSSGSIALSDMDSEEFY